MLSTPKLRDDLAISRQETSSGTVFIVKDPTTGDFFRIREAEHFIAAQMDGKTPIDVVRQRTEERFQASVTRDALNAFVRTLDGIGLLDKQAAPGRTRGGAKMSLLYLRVRLFDPDRLFNYLEPRLRWMFKPTFMISSALVIVLAVVTSVLNWDEYLTDLPRAV